MEGRNYIDVSVPNVITITLINIVGTVLLGIGLKLYRQYKQAA